MRQTERELVGAVEAQREARGNPAYDGSLPEFREREREWLRELQGRMRQALSSLSDRRTQSVRERRYERTLLSHFSEEGPSRVFSGRPVNVSSFSSPSPLGEFLVPGDYDSTRSTTTTECPPSDNVSELTPPSPLSSARVSAGTVNEPPSNLTGSNLSPNWAQPVLIISELPARANNEAMRLNVQVSLLVNGQRGYRLDSAFSSQA
ncbi:MAG: hypothetical protein KVP17_005360 [Porospora cf. gigantea B]|uniref:uncharacterized protein n=1 Tax=Porospora cf. gigantea B TaxID=2853592 RepID=UPI003571A8F3|nr:MAG: hypothetical protein KVP17_005360 [Porospora cf. gigantea B]